MPLSTLPYAAKITARATDANGVLLLTFQVIDGAAANRGSTVTAPIEPADGGQVTLQDIKRVASIVATNQAAADAGTRAAVLQAYITQGIAL